MRIFKFLPVLLLPIASFAQQKTALPCYTTEISEAKKIHFLETGINPTILKKGNDAIRIPVVVHVIHDGIPNVAIAGPDPMTYEDNIPDSNIYRQIARLNEDFNRINPDAVNTVADFQGVAGNMPIEFVLAAKDPAGNPTTGIDRVLYPGFSHAGFATNQEIETVIKPLTSWDPSRYFNIWTIRFAESTGTFALLGYAQFPDSSKLAGMPSDNSPQTANTDGIVINPIVFGTIGADDYFSSNSRTTVHEVGHALGLRHIWGDGDCSATDYVDDTPPASGPSGGCNPAQMSCNGLNMVQNYMDYTNGACQNLFTLNQIDRMYTVMANSPRRRELPNSDVFPDSPTAISTKTGISKTLTVFPNPCQNVLNITISNQEDNNTVEVFNLLGEKILQQKTSNGIVPIDVSTLTSGTYFVKYNQQKTIFVKL